MRRDRRTAHIVVGHDCTFGNRRRGTPQMLRERGAELGFGVTVVEPVRGEGAVYSSTHIRELLKAGKPREAAAQLGRFWEIDGRVALGDQRGRTIGFPTANIGLGEYLRPALGVYAVRVSGDRRRRPARRQDHRRRRQYWPPTHGRQAPCRASTSICSTSIAIPTAGICAVALVDFIRPEKKFASFDELKHQIAIDAQTGTGSSWQPSAGKAPTRQQIPALTGESRYPLVRNSTGRSVSPGFRRVEEQERGPQDSSPSNSLISAVISLPWQ